jgi:4-aminobutyrate aminotransferase-like enzyme
VSEWEYFSRNTKPKSVEILEADGARFKTSSGQWVLDFCAQTLNLNLGHRHPVIQEAMFEAAQSYTFLSSRFSNPYSNALVSELVASLPEPLNRVCIKMTSGTEANEGALKAAYKRQGTTSVVAVMKSNHGQSTETMRVAGKHFHRAYLDKSGVSYIDPCNCGAHDPSVTCNCSDQLRELLEALPTVPSALIIEPILVDAGVMVPSANFLHDLRSITQDAGMGLIFDEVQTCMGWTGDLYGLTHFGVTPDIVTFGKGFAAGLPLSATVSKDDWDVMDYGENEFTPGANPIFAAVALANLRLVRDETSSSGRAWRSPRGARRRCPWSRFHLGHGNPRRRRRSPVVHLRPRPRARPPVAREQGRGALQHPADQTAAGHNRRGTRPGSRDSG